jgi:hypothetical protein
MTTQKKAGLTAGGLGLGALVLAIIGYWPQVEPILTWAVQNVAGFFTDDHVQAVLVAMLCASFLGILLPHVLPGAWPRRKSRLVSGLACAALATAVTAWLVPTKTGVVAAVLSFLAAPTVSVVLVEGYYWLRPSARPESLQP